MKSLPVAQPRDDCWNRIGVRGDRSCPELPAVVHCHNCPVYSAAGRRFLDAPSPEGYLDEWTDRLSAPLEEAAADRLSVLILKLGEEWLAVSVHVLVEVTHPRPVHRVPHRGGLLAGLVNIRGDLHLCVRLHQLLSIETPATQPPRARLVVIRQESLSWAFAADEVDQVHRLTRRDLTPPPQTLGRSLLRHTRGMFSWKDQPVGLLDETTLFQTLKARVR